MDITWNHVATRFNAAEEVLSTAKTHKYRGRDSMKQKQMTFPTRCCNKFTLSVQWFYQQRVFFHVLLLLHLFHFLGFFSHRWDCSFAFLWLPIDWKYMLWAVFSVFLIQKTRSPYPIKVISAHRFLNLFLSLTDWFNFSHTHSLIFACSRFPFSLSFGQFGLWVGRSIVWPHRVHRINKTFSGHSITNV